MLSSDPRLSVSAPQRLKADGGAPLGSSPAVLTSIAFTESRPFDPPQRVASGPWRTRLSAFVRRPEPRTSRTKQIPPRRGRPEPIAASLPRQPEHGEPPALVRIFRSLGVDKVEEGFKTLWIVHGRSLPRNRSAIKPRRPPAVEAVRAARGRPPRPADGAPRRVRSATPAPRR